MASVRRMEETSTGKVSFQANWSIYDKEGKRKRQTKVFERERDAKAHAAKMEAEVERRGIGDAEKQTFAAFSKRVLAHWETGATKSWK